MNITESLGSGGEVRIKLLTSLEKTVRVIDEMGRFGVGKLMDFREIGVWVRRVVEVFYLGKFLL